MRLFAIPILHDAHSYFKCPLFDPLNFGTGLYTTAGIKKSPANVTNPDDGVVLPTTFPWQLHLLLDDAEIKGFSDVVSWLEAGTMFKVHKTKEFVDRIMPRYFNQTRYKSFQRQLNSYRFHRFVAGKNKGTCFHELFIRDKPDLCTHISRVKVNRGPRRPADAAAQPQIDGCMFEPVAITYPSTTSSNGHCYSKVEDKACENVNQDPSTSLLSSRGTIPFWCVGEMNRDMMILGRHQLHPGVKRISDCIPPVIASEIVNIFGSHGGGDNVYQTHRAPESWPLLPDDERSCPRTTCVRR
jgi:hypothetical protein